VRELEIEELTCFQTRQYFEKYYCKRLPEDIEEAVIEHLRKCESCDDAFLEWVRCYALD